MELLQIIVIAAVFWAIYHIGRMAALNDIAKIIDHLDQYPDQATIIAEESLRIERGTEGYFAYDHQGEFIAHHPTELKGLLDRVGDRFPQRHWFVDQEDIEQHTDMPLEEFIKVYCEHMEARRR